MLFYVVVHACCSFLHVVCLRDKFSPSFTIRQRLFTAAIGFEHSPCDKMYQFKNILET